MAHRILIPTPLRPYTDKQDAVEADGATVGECCRRSRRSYGELRRHLYNDDGKLRTSSTSTSTTKTSAICRRSDAVKSGRHHQHHSVGGRRRAGDGASEAGRGGARAAGR